MWDSYWPLYGYVGFERVLKGYKEFIGNFIGAIVCVGFGVWRLRRSEG